MGKQSTAPHLDNSYRVINDVQANQRLSITSVIQDPDEENNRASGHGRTQI